MFTQAVTQQRHYATTDVGQTAGDDLIQIILRVPAETRRQMKIKAATLDTSMNEYVCSLIEGDLKLPQREREGE
jgi:hypothetical protein